MKSIQILFQKWQLAQKTFLAIAVLPTFITSVSIKAHTEVSTVNNTEQKKHLYIEKNNEFTTPTSQIESTSITPLVNEYEEFLLQVSASRNEVRIRELADFYRELGFSVYLMIVETAPYPFKLIIGNSWDSWSSVRVFKERNQSMIPQDAFIHRPHTITETLVPFED